MLSFLHKLREKFRHGLIAHIVLIRLSRLGIRINPYIIYREGSSSITENTPLEPSVERVTLENFERLISGCAFEAQVSLDGWKKKLQEGQLGLVMRLRGELVGYTWANLKYCFHYGRRTELGPKQAYLRDTYISKRFRGQGMAVLIRQAMYRELLRRERTEFFSVSEFLNTPAKNFKSHLGAMPLELRLSLKFFGHRNANIRLRTYADAAWPGHATEKR